MKRKLLSLAAFAACAFAGSAQAQISDGIVKIGVMNDMSGLYSDITGPGSVTAARMAVEDYIKASSPLAVSGGTLTMATIPSTASRLRRPYLNGWVKGMPSH